ncbi:MAG: hypothetical protein QME64_13120, partial [bacterium]|nr:hypothetical protein [bacterium]
MLRKVVSGKYDATSTLNSTNVVVFPASGPRTTDQYIALGYHIQGTPIVKGIAEYSCPTTWENTDEGYRHTAMRLNFLDVKSAPDGTIFAAIYGTKNAWNSSYYYEFMYVYRYNDLAFSWNTVVTMEWQYDNSDPAGGEEQLGGLAIAADTGYLWLAISVLDRNIGYETPLHIKIAAIPYSSFPSTITIDSSIWKVPQGLENKAPQLHMSYDEKFNKDYGRPTVRLIYYNDPDGRIYASRIEYKLLSGGGYGPSLERDTTVYSESAVNISGYRIACNPNDITSAQKQAFATLETGAHSVRVGHSFNLNAQDPAYEYWTDHTSYGTMHAFTNDLTYRATGEKLVVWTEHVGHCSPVVYSNVGDIDPG